MTRTAILPELAVRGGRAAVEFYKAAYGAVEVYRVGGTEQHESLVSQLTIGAASCWVHEESPANGLLSPDGLGGCTVRLLLVVEDPDSVVERAVAAGARVVSPVGEEHGWRLGRILDPFGHHWEIGFRSRRGHRSAVSSPRPVPRRRSQIGERGGVGIQSTPPRLSPSGVRWRSSGSLSAASVPPARSVRAAHARSLKYRAR